MHEDRVPRATILTFVSKKNGYKLKAKVNYWVRCSTLLRFWYRAFVLFHKKSNSELIHRSLHPCNFPALVWITPVVMEMRTGSGWGKRLMVQTKGWWNDRRKLCQSSPLLFSCRLTEGLKGFPGSPSQQWKITVPPQFSPDMFLLLRTESQTNENEDIYLWSTLKSWHDWQCCTERCQLMNQWNFLAAQQFGAGLEKSAKGGWGLLGQQLPLMMAGSQSQGSRDPFFSLGNV